MKALVPPTLSAAKVLREYLGEDLFFIVEELTLGGWRAEDICLFLLRDFNKTLTVTEVFTLTQWYKIKATPEALKRRRRFKERWSSFRTSFTVQGNVFLSPSSIGRNLSL